MVICFFLESRPPSGLFCTYPVDGWSDLQQAVRFVGLTQGFFVLLVALLLCSRMRIRVRARGAGGYYVCK